MRLMRARLRLLRKQDGIAMIAVVGAMALITTLAGATLAATNGDLGLIRRDLDDKRAYAAAQAGVADYSFHLNNDNNYWADCTSVPPPHAVNQQGSTANRRTVPGTTDATYAIELLPATGQASCSTTNPVGSMLEASGPNTGSFRIRATGWAGDASASIVVTYKRASLLDYIYFTQLETSDPVTYGFTGSALAGAYSQCSKYRRDGRYSQPMPNTGGQYCNVIVFVSGDDIDGPLHTNDALQICGTPSFGRSAADVIEVSNPPVGWYSSCGGGDNPNFVGPFVTTAPVLTPPPTNGKLKTIAGPSNTYDCQTRVQLSGSNMTITTNSGSTVGPVSFPTDGVLYVSNANCANSPSCSSSYNPFTVTYPARSDCGTVRVSGSYSGQLTIAAENDIIITDDITRTGGGLLGLVANNFVRVYHPFCQSGSSSCGTSNPSSGYAQTGPGNCNGGSNGTGSQSNLRIDAALLAIQHSFIVDHYDCGSSLGEIEVNGALSQKWRGPVGTTGGTGYLKDYNYDDRLRYQEPPNFLDPVESAWHIQRETLDYP
jgi:hypothetical protein